MDELTARWSSDIPPTLIFANLRIAGSNSPLNTLEHIQKLFPAVSIIALTDPQDYQLAVKCIQAGAQSFVVKGAYDCGQILQILTTVHKQNELNKELDRLKEEYQNLFDANPAPTLVVDTISGRFIAVNKAAVNTYGYTKEEFRNITLEDIGKPHEIGAGSLKVETIETSTYARHYNKAGMCLFVQLTKNEILYKGVDSQLVTVYDVTEKVFAAEEELKARQRLDAIFKRTHDAILLTDQRGRYIQVNPAACDMLGYTEEEFLTLSVSDIVHQLVSETDDQNLWNKFLKSSSQRGIIELRRKPTGAQNKNYVLYTSSVIKNINYSLPNFIFSGSTIDVRLSGLLQNDGD